MLGNFALLAHIMHAMRVLPFDRAPVVVSTLSAGEVGEGSTVARSSCGAELVESFGQSISRRLVRCPSWQGEASAVHFLEAVPEHRPIDLIHEGPVDVDDVIR